MKNQDETTGAAAGESADPPFDITLDGADVSDTMMNLSIRLRMAIPRGSGSEEEQRRIIKIMKKTTIADIYLMINEKLQETPQDGPVP